MFQSLLLLLLLLLLFPLLLLLLLRRCALSFATHRLWCQKWNPAYCLSIAPSFVPGNVHSRLMYGLTRSRDGTNVTSLLDAFYEDIARAKREGIFMGSFGLNCCVFLISSNTMYWQCTKGHPRWLYLT